MARTPKPTKQRQLEGNPGKRPLKNATPPQAAFDKFPDPPVGLGKYGRRLWMEDGRILYNEGRLNPGSVTAFTVLCETWQRYKAVCELLKGPADCLAYSKDGSKVSPNYRIASKERADFWTMARDFGMTPKAAEALGDGEKEGEPDELEALLKFLQGQN